MKILLNVTRFNCRHLDGNLLEQIDEKALGSQRNLKKLY